MFPWNMGFSQAVIFSICILCMNLYMNLTVFESEPAKDRLMFKVKMSECSCMFMKVQLILGNQKAKNTWASWVKIKKKLKKK